MAVNTHGGTRNDTRPVISGALFGGALCGLSLLGAATSTGDSGNTLLISTVIAITGLVAAVASLIAALASLMRSRDDEKPRRRRR